MSYIERLLPFSNSLKSKEILIHCDGEIKRMGKHFSFVLMVAYSHPWTWNMSAFHSNSFVISFSSSRSPFMIHFTPLSQFKECIILPLHYDWSLPWLSQCCQVTCHDIQCSRGVLITVYFCSYFTFLQVGRIRVSLMLVPLLESLQKSLLFPRFVSMMRETSCPSLDESIPIDTNHHLGIILRN